MQIPKVFKQAVPTSSPPLGNPLTRLPRLPLKLRLEPLPLQLPILVEPPPLLVPPLALLDEARALLLLAAPLPRQREPLGACLVQLVRPLVLQHARVHDELGPAAGVDHGEGAAGGAFGEGWVLC